MLNPIKTEYNFACFKQIPSEDSSILGTDYIDSKKPLRGETLYFTASFWMSHRYSSHSFYQSKALNDLVGHLSSYWFSAVTWVKHFRED